MKLTKVALSISIVVYGTTFAASAAGETIYSSGSREFASLLTFDEKYKTSSSFIVTGSGTSVTAKYRNTSPLSGTVSIGNGAATGDTDAYMLVENGAAVSADQNIFIGSDSSLSSYVTVSGEGSTLNSPQIRVGNAGAGTNNTLNIIEGGHVTAFDVYAGYGADGTINVQGKGSDLTVKPGSDAAGTPFQQLTVGSGGYAGTLNVSDRGVVNITDGALLSLGGNGTGSSGSGYLNITNGGVVNAGMVAAGNSTDRSDTAIAVEGAGSALNASTLYLGADEGTAKATVADGGSITVTDKLYLAASNAGTAEMNIASGGTLSVGGEGGIVYGGSSTPARFILSGGTLQAYNALLSTGINMALAEGSTSSLDSNGVGMSLSGALTGAGSLRKTGAGTLVLSGNNTYTGSTSVNSGTLTLDREDAIASTSDMTVNKSAILNLNGHSQTLTRVDNQGTVLINSYGDDALTNAVIVTGDMVNSGTLVLNNCSTCAGQTYVQDGNWVGNGGTVSLGSVLSGDDSLTDKLAITGHASGQTSVAVTNEGGNGAQTLEGIELISTGSSASGAFVQKGRIVAGSYEYHLQQGNTSGTNQNNWYLTSQNGNGESGSGEDHNTGDGGNQDNGGGQQTYRPERGSYASNLAAAGTLFNTRLSDRRGSGIFTDPLTGERYATSLWARAVGGHTEGKLSDAQSGYTANRMVFQLGGNVLDGSFTGSDDWHLGIMGGYGKQDSNTRNGLSGYRSKGQVRGYSSGVYGTWYQNAQSETGLYVDSWLLYNWFDNTVKGDGLANEKYRSKGVTASLESGYTFHTGSYLTSGGMQNNVYLRPQAQVIWSGVRADDHTEQNGTRVSGLGSDNVQTRLGVRLSATGQSVADKDTVRRFEPFVEANWIYSTRQYGVRMGQENAYVKGSRNVAELKTGLEGRLSQNLSIWGNVAQQLGDSGYRDTQGTLGLKYHF